VYVRPAARELLLTAISYPNFEFALVGATTYSTGVCAMDAKFLCELPTKDHSKVLAMFATLDELSLSSTFTFTGPV
jgi:hypothetical protein